MRPLSLLLAAWLAAAPATAATLRTATTLEGPTVKLSDLFDDAGPQAGRVLGPGPAPGERIVVGATQLAAIARQFGVDWQPSSSADHAVLEQPGRMLPRALVLAALHEALVRVGAPEASEAELEGFDAPLIPVPAQPRVLVEQLDYRAGADHFTASLLIDGKLMPPMRLQLAGAVEELVEVALPVRRVAAGQVLRAGDVALGTVRASSLHGEVAHELAQAVGYVLRHPAAPGQPMLLADLSRPLAVAKGARVAMELRTPGLTVLGLGIAMAPGALGDHIEVMNPTSRMVVEAEVIGHDRVAVAPGSTPAPADSQVAVQ